MRKTISLILAIVLSLTIFVSDIAGITMIVRAEENVEDEGGSVDSAYDDGGEEYPSDPEPEYVPDDPAPSEPEPAPAEPEPAPSEPEPAPVEPAPVEPAPVEPAPVDPAPQPQPGADDDEKAREEAYEKAAKEAEEAAKQAADDAAAQEAQRLAEEAAKQAAKEAEEAQKAEEENKKKGGNYSLTATVASSAVSRVSFGSAFVGEQRDYVPLDITNTGDTTVELIYTKTNDADNAFSLSFHSSNPTLAPGDTARFNVSMSSSLGVGDYKASAKFADAGDPNYKKALSVALAGTVTPKKEIITDIDVIPSKISLAKGGSAQFYAAVSGNADKIYNIIWSLAGNRSKGTSIDKNGILTIANNEPAAVINVFATTAEDPSVKGVATVNVQSNSYNVNAYASPANGGKVSGGGAVAAGGSVTLSAVPNRNFYFDGWIVDGRTVSTATNYTIKNVQSNIDVTASFSQNYVTVTVTSNNPNGGDVVGGGRISYGGSTTISAKAYDGYVFTGWKEGDSIVSKDASVKLTNLTVDRKLTAMFHKTRHTLTVVAYPSEGGSVTGGGTYKINEGTTVKASASPGWTFQGWQVNGQYVSRSAEYYIDKISQDYTITAIFLQNSAITYEMSSGVATTGGTITPCGKLTVTKGQQVTYTITPKSGFAILAVAVDGVQVGPVSTYTFSNIESNHMIAVAFLQTDAGKAAAEASGKVTQADKVKPIPKTINNTATSNSTVDIDTAANGEGGDDYVEEMEGLDEIPVPTDDQLGITIEEESEPESEVIRLLGLPAEEVSNMVRDGNTMPILDAAFLTGGLGAYVYNKYEPTSMVSVDYNSMTREELMQASADEINPSLPDLDIVVQKMLSGDDVTKLVKGEHLDISVSLTEDDDPDEPSVRIMKNAVGKKPMRYFDLTMLKSVDGNTEKVNELPTTMEVVIEVPQDIYKKGKTYSVLRVHDGELSVLPDLDDDPKTITFRTDRFSLYAIAQDVTSASSLVAWLAAGAIISLGIALTCLLILVEHHRRMRKRARGAKA
ncbi:MAG: hypothetical protein K6G58_05610 [Lachnospiraceae bacterium]|nr:hypothetical protein [Lachnospiraceae bacterium]